VLGGVFLVAGVLKAVDPQSSAAAVRAYQLLPNSLATVVGWGLPFAEIALGLLLLAGIATRAVAAAAAMLLVVFIAAVVSVAARGLSIDCGCLVEVVRWPLVRRRTVSNWFATQACCCLRCGWCGSRVAGWPWIGLPALGPGHRNERSQEHECPRTWPPGG
jgi:hypothetical protein